MVGAVIAADITQHLTGVDELLTKHALKGIVAAIGIEKLCVLRQQLGQHIGGGGCHQNVAVLVRVGGKELLHLLQVFLILCLIKSIGGHLGKIVTILAQPCVVDLQLAHGGLLHGGGGLHPKITQHDLIGGVLLGVGGILSRE